MRDEATFESRLDAYQQTTRSDLASTLASTRGRGPGHWVRYASAAAATAAMAGTAEASILFSGPQDADTLPLNFPYYPFTSIRTGATSIDLDLDGEPDFAIEVRDGPYSDTGSAKIRALSPEGAVAVYAGFARYFSSGSSIGPLAEFRSPTANLFHRTF